MHVTLRWLGVSTLRQLDAALRGLSMVAEVQLREHAAAGRPLPLLYESGVRYKMELPGQENWKTPVVCLRDGYADCEDLAAWLAAELRVQGKEAWPGCYRPRPGLVHCVVWCTGVGGTGQRLDPSRVLGMGARRE